MKMNYKYKKNNFRKNLEILNNRKNNKNNIVTNLNKN